MTERRRDAGLLAVSIATLAWAFPPLVLKETDMEPLAFAAYRLWVGVAMYAVIFLVTGRRLRWTTIKACAPGGLIFAVDIAFAFSAFKLASVAEATIIGAFSTVTIAIGAALWFGERMKRSDFTFVGASLIGVVLVAVGSLGGPTFNLLGDLFAVASVFSWTAYWLFSKKARANAGALEYMATVMLVAAIAMTIMAPLSGASLALPNAQDWLGIVLVALFAGAIGHSLVAWSHQHLDAWLASVILQTQPLVSVTLAWFVLGEAVSWVTAGGGLLVIAATTALVVRSGRRNPGEFEDAEPVTPAP